MNSFTMMVGRKLIPPENGTVKEKSFVVSLNSGGKGKSYVREVFTLSNSVCLLNQNTVNILSTTQFSSFFF